MYAACIIGTGRIASKLEKDPLRPPGCSHAGAYRLAPNINLLAGADIDAAALEEFGADWNIPPGERYADYRKMLQARPYDIASIAAYAPERLEMVQAALDAGAKGLWLEKALGCSLADAVAIEQAIRDAGARAVVDYPRRGRAPYRAVKRLVEEETFGKLLSVTCHMTHQLIHTGTHAFDILRYLCGEALSVSGTLEPLDSPSKARWIQDRGGIATIQMSNGATAFVSARKKRFYIFQFDFLFEDARILLGNDIAKVYRPKESRNYTGFQELFETPHFDWGAPHARDMLAELTHSMETGEEPLFSVANAVEALRLALAIFESDRQGRPIAPSAVPTDLRVENV